MTWLKDAYLDIIVLLMVGVFALYPSAIFEVIIWVYSGLLILSKLLAFFMPSLQQKANKTGAPPLFYHMVYALTVAIFFFIAKYYLAAAWVVIWLFSAVTSFKSKNKSQSE